MSRDMKDIAIREMSDSTTTDKSQVPGHGRAQDSVVKPDSTVDLTAEQAAPQTERGSGELVGAVTTPPQFNPDGSQRSDQGAVTPQSLVDELAKQPSELAKRAIDKFDGLSPKEKQDVFRIIGEKMKELAENGKLSKGAALLALLQAGLDVAGQTKPETSDTLIVR